MVKPKYTWIKPMRIKDYIILASVVIIWGINFLFMKFALNEIPPMIAGMLRFLCVLMPAIFILKRPKVQWRLLILYGLTISFGQFSLMFLALSWHFPTGLAALILQAQAFLMVLFAFLMLGELLKKISLLGMTISAVGLGLIGVGQYQGGLSLVGVLPVLGAAVSWACGNIVVKKIGQVDALSLVVWGSVSSFCAFTLCALWLYGVAGIGMHLANLTYKGVLGIVFLAYVASLVGYTGFGFVLARNPASKVSLFILLVPVIALIVDFVFLGERLNGWHLLGIVVVMSGLLVHLFVGLWWERIKRR